MKILCLTLNPAVDQSIYLHHLSRGEVHRAEKVLYNAGGKGVNVASCLADWGMESLATGFLGRDNESIFQDLFRKKKIEDAFIRLEGATRVNVKIMDDGETTDINLPGPAAGPNDLKALGEFIASLKNRIGEFSLAVLSGSLPPGAPETIYRDLIDQLAGMGLKCLLDASGPALALALKAEVKPFAVKPNGEELSEALGRALKSDSQIIEAAKELVASGIGLAGISLGEEGAFFASPEGLLKAGLAAEKITGTVGAGDALAAGLAAAISQGLGLEETARLATAFAVGKLSLVGPNLPGKKEIRRLAEKTWIKRL